MGREENREIFENTRKMCSTHQILMEAIKDSNRRQILTPESEMIGVNLQTKRYDNPAEILVSKKRTFQAASAYNGKKICVLNFASATNPGGGVTHGSSAQEESLCRCSTLYFNLNQETAWADFYHPHRKSKNPLHNDDCIYTPDVVVFKTDSEKPQLLPEHQWHKVDVITCAAPNLRKHPSNRMNMGDGNEAVSISNKDLKEIHKKRLRRILDLAVLHENEVVILGAFGCGAFENSPEVVAAAMREVVTDYKYSFETIEFAVYCSRKDETNYRIFNRVMQKI